MAKVILFIFLFGFFINCNEPLSKKDLKVKKRRDSVEITILVDNKRTAIEGMKPIWGFSAYIVFNDKHILFDTGASPDILANNAKLVGITPKDIDMVFLSHYHKDHTGGIEWLKDYHKKVFLLKSFPQYIKEKLPHANLEEISRTTYIDEHMYSVVLKGSNIDEQSLVLDTDKGLFIITGCSHTGILRIINDTLLLKNKNIHLVMGGFHLVYKTMAEIEYIASQMQELPIDYVLPAHCSGHNAYIGFRRILHDKVIEPVMGKTMKF